jgi:hypothetical protein
MAMVKVRVCRIEWPDDEPPTSYVMAGDSLIEAEIQELFDLGDARLTWGEGWLDWEEK